MSTPPTPTTATQPKPAAKSEALIVCERIEQRTIHAIEDLTIVMTLSQEERDELRTLRSDIVVLRGYLEQLPELHAMIVELRDLMQKQATTLAAAAPSHNPPANSTTFHADTILMTYDDSGKQSFKVKGGRYAKFGVRVWPEVLPLLGINPAELKPGPNSIDMNVVVELEETFDEEAGAPVTKARKVIGKA